MEDVEVVATVALSLVPGIGSRRLRQLVSTFGSAQAALDAPQSRLAATDGIGRGAATAIKAASAADGARVLETLAGLGARLLLPGDPEFPPQLEEIPDPQATYDLLRREAAAYSKELAAKPHVVVLTKADLHPIADSRYPIALRTDAGAPVVEISAVARQGIPDLLEVLWKTLKS